MFSSLRSPRRTSPSKATGPQLLEYGNSRPLHASHEFFADAVLCRQLLALSQHRNLKWRTSEIAKIFQAKLHTAAQ